MERRLNPLVLNEAS